MREVKLIQSIELFGFWEGFKFWFRWCFVDPIRIWIWLNITHRTYCCYTGFYCNDENCGHQHLTKKKDIMKRWKK